jgi:putative peptidoglycan lipid II flippase
MSLVRSTLLVAAASAASRVLGFVRDMLFAQVLGAGPVADAFLAAFRLPNLLRRVLGEGGLNPALIPLLARLGPDEGRRFAGEALSGLALALLAVAALVELSAGAAVLFLAPGLGDDPRILALAATYTRLSFPLVVGVTLASLIAAILNHHRRFAVAAIAPLIVNLGLIGVLMWLRTDADVPLAEEAAWLAAASSIAGFVQLGLVGLALVGSNAPVRMAWPRWSPALRTLLGTGFVSVVASAAVQLFVLVGTQVASFQPSGVAWLYYADRVAQLPVGIIASVVGVVLLPELAARHAAGERAVLMAAQEKALQLALLIALPAALALAILAGPITAVLFQRGAFGPDDGAGTAAALIGLSASLPFAVVGKVLSQTLFARGAIQATVLALIAGLAATAGGAVVLSPALGILGVGLGIALGCLVHSAVLAAFLRREGLWSPSDRLWRQAGRIVLASAVLGLALAGAVTRLPPSAVALTGLCLGGLALYALAAWATGAVTREEWVLLTKKAEGRLQPGARVP